MWNTNYGKGLTEAEPNIPGQRLDPRQRGLGLLEGVFVFLKRSLQTPTAHPSGESPLPFMSFVIILRRKFVRKITESEKFIFYMYATFFFFFPKASSLPSHPKKVKPILQRSIWSFSSKWLQRWHQTRGRSRAGGSPARCQHRDCCGCHQRVWAAPYPNTSALMCDWINKAESTL